ncbi:MAG TPA: APC family permease [Bryobacteraceae bacterium]|nr:APC family permease [Bryobacteraceae bacterium]
MAIGLLSPVGQRVPRKITLLSLIAATYFIVAGGPFGLEDIVSKAGYAGALLILLVTPLLWALPTVLMVSELASTLPQDGGYYIWASRSMGRFWGFQEAWLSIVGGIFDIGIYPTLFVEYVGHFAPSVTAGGRGIWIKVGLIAACALWNLLGAARVGGSSVWMGVFLLAPFVLLTGYAFTHRVAQAGAPIPLHNVDFLGGILVAMWNYMSWDQASTVAGEVERPQRTYPLAMAAAILLVTLSYLLPVGAVALTGLDPNRWSTGGWADVARAVVQHPLLAEVLAVGITIGGMIGAVGTLNAQVMTFSRLPAVLAEDRFLPIVLARRLSRTGAPWVAIAACSVVWALSLGMSFTKLVLLDVLLTGLSVLLEFASLVALRIREPELPRPYRVPGGFLVASLLGVPSLVLLVLAAVRNYAEPVGPMNALEFGGILIVLGVVAYFLGDQTRKHDHR